jgi:WD40 repeat protein
MDISRDSANLHSTCGAYELLFWDLNSGKQMTGGATMLRDEHWATWTTTLGWPVQGIWPKCADGTFYNAVDRSHFTINGTTFKEDPKAFYLLATGNDLGKVNIFNYPCLDKGALSIECRGHSSHVTNVRWSADDEYIISTGGEDQCVMQWRVYKTKTTTKKSKKV